MGKDSAPSDLQTAHEADVRRIQAQIEQSYVTKTPFRFYHGSSVSSQTRKQGRNMINTTNLNRIIELTPEYAVAEPNVNFGQLIKETLKIGRIPPVVPGMVTLTCGGCFCAIAGDTTSFRHGLFCDTVEEIEVILANGETKRVQKGDSEELFQGFSISAGTLGAVMSMKIPLIEAKPLVLFTYERAGSVESAVKRLKELANDETVDIVECWMFEKHEALIMHGRYANEDAHTKTLPRKQFTRKNDPWCYINGREILYTKLRPYHTDENGDVRQSGEADDEPEKRQSFTEAIPIYDYLFRHDRGAFWMGEFAFAYFMMPFNDLTRRLLDRLMTTKTQLLAYSASGLNDRYVVHDMSVPEWSAADFFEYVDEAWGQYPVLIVPFTSKQDNEMFVLRNKEGKIIQKSDLEEHIGFNFGIYGPGPSDPVKFLELEKNLERRMRELGGLQMFYSQMHSTKEDFWNMVDKKRYDQVRERCGAAGYLPDLWEKFSAGSLGEVGLGQRIMWRVDWPWRGIYGVWCVGIDKVRRMMGWA